MDVLIPGDIIQKKEICLFKIQILARKRAITGSWLKCDHPPPPVTPRPGQWLDIVQEIYLMEKLTPYLRTKAETQEQCWEKGLRTRKGTGCVLSCTERK